ncbi:MAG: putative DNA binding domain-containing protein [Candidatus Marinimicrobia bacterium]|nr:putative DNA binding domain-containing protein [Candidatus Neomarinimicrobiota bacterium]
MTDKLLKNFINNGGNEQLVFTATVHKTNIAKHLCGFLNASGGKVILGVDKKGKIIGINNPSKHIHILSRYLISYIVPEAPISISVEEIDGLNIICIKVCGGTRKPYLFDGSIYYRMDNSTTKASSNEVSLLIHERHISEQHWERKLLPNTNLENFDTKLILRTIKEAQKRNRTNYRGNNILDFLSYYGLYTNSMFTNACMLLFGKNPIKYFPQTRVRLTEFSNNKTDDYIPINRYIEGNLFEIKNQLEEYVNNLGIRSVLGKDKWQRKNFKFPVNALQEGIINALMHRDYTSISGGISINIFPNRFIISNTGQLPDSIKIKDFKREHIPHPVNPDIAHMMFLNGYSDEFGRGALRILNLCNEAGLQIPIWKQTNSEITLTFNGPKLPKEKEIINKQLPLKYDNFQFPIKSNNVLCANRNIMKIFNSIETLKEPTIVNVKHLLVASEAISEAVSVAASEAISEAVSVAASEAISEAVKIRFLKEIIILASKRFVNIDYLIDEIDVSKATLQKDLALLKQFNYVSFEGSSKTGYYKLTENLIKKINKNL